MAENGLTQLYPLPVRELPLEGAYLAHDLRQRADATHGTFVYSNFVVSVDGRIAVPRPDGVGMQVPPDTANERDWRLFQELSAQADILITNGRYLRERAAGYGQPLAQMGHNRFADLRAWREDRGLPPRPALAVISRSLHFPIPDTWSKGDREVVVVTTAGADQDRVREIERRLGPVIVAGEENVAGDRMVRHLHARGYRMIYSVSGPRVLHLLLASGVLDRLYITYANRILGNNVYDTLVEGPQFDPAIAMKISSIYLDPSGLDRLGQLFVAYDLV